MVKAKKRGSGRGSGKGVSADRYRRQLTQVLAKMGDEEVLRLCAEAQDPAFVSPGPPPPRDDDGESVPAIDFPTFAEHMETLVNMIDSRGDIGSPECAALGTFICNHGTKEDNAEAFLAIMPVATRVFIRCNAEDAARREAERAAVKGKVCSGA